MRFLAYPLVLTLVLAAACLAIERGWPLSPSLVAIQVVAAAVVALLERALPYREEWRRSHQDGRTDVAFLVSSGAAQGLGQLLVGLPFLALAPARGWPASWPLLVQLPLALVVSELGVYALHRLQHGGGWLWRIHAIHHSAPRLYWLNSARNHPLDTLAYPIVALLPLLALGADERLVALVLVFQGTHAFFQHSNVDVRLGPLNWVLSMAEVHRWHHSRRLDEANANYGQTLLVWDVLLGTRAVPEGEPPEDTGLAGLPRFPRGFLGQLGAPFRWRSVSGG